MNVKIWLLILFAPKGAETILCDNDGLVWYFTNGVHKFGDALNKTGIPFNQKWANEGMFLADKLGNGRWYIHRNRHSEASKKLIELGYKWNDSTGWTLDN